MTDVQLGDTRLGDGRGAPATFAERGRARAIDAAIFFVLAMPVAAISDLFASDTVSTAGTATGTRDPASTVAGLLLLAIGVAYDPLTTAWFGTTPGKRLAGLRVVTEGTGERVAAWRLVVRSIAEWMMFWVGFVPWVASVASARKDPLVRTWHDRLAGTLVVKDAVRKDTPQPHRELLREPWASAVTEARQAQTRFTNSRTSLTSGPLRERLGAVARRVDRCVKECEALAVRGDQLAVAAENIDQDDVALEAEEAAVDSAAHPSDHTRADLASALADQAASAKRVEELVGTTERTLRRLVAQLNDAVNRAIEVTYSDSPETGFASLVDELESLKLGFIEAREVAASGTL